MGQLLDFNLGASFFELLLGGVGIGLVSTLEHGLGSAFNQGFGFRQTEAGFHFAHGFDDRDLLVSGGRGENHVKRVLRSSRRSSSSTTTASSRSSGHSSGSAHAPFGFQFFDQVSDFDDRRIAQLFYDVCFI